MKHLGFIAALPAEAVPLKPRTAEVGQLLHIENDISLIISGIGAEAAARAANLLLQSGVKHLISWGTAAALQPSMKSGDIVMPDKLMHISKTPLQTSAAGVLFKNNLMEILQQNNKRLSRRTILDVDKFLTSPSVKHELNSQYNAVAADMESYSICEVAHQNGIKASVVRVITDSTEQSVPAFLTEALDDYGNPLFPDFYLKLMRQPGELPDLIRLAMGFSKATSSLRLLSKLLKYTD